MSGLGYITADRIGEISGGGLVCSQELLALREFSEEQTLLRRDPLLSSITILSRDNLGNNLPEPWRWDDTLVARQDFPTFRPKLAHFYSGSFPKTVALLKERGCRISYTIAAHDKEVSRKEHEKLGWPFPYTHLTDPKLWWRYIDCYRLADVIICPSTVAEKTVRAYGSDFEKKDIRVIPHGCDLPEWCRGRVSHVVEEYKQIIPGTIKPLPSTYTVGYLGVYGADKGVRYLLEAWKRLDYKDGSVLVLGGRDSTSPIAKHLVDRFGGGNIRLTGWLKSTSDFYNSISVLVQPSATEGFGCPVLEAMAHGRPVICSDGAGAVDLVRREYDPPGDVFQAGNVEQLMEKIESYKKGSDVIENTASMLSSCVDIASEHTWDKIRQRYRKVWEGMLQ